MTKYFSILIIMGAFLQVIEPKKNYLCRGVTFDVNCQTDGEEIALSKVMALPEVKLKGRYIDSLTNHKKGITLLVVKKPLKKRDYYWIQAGYDNAIRFEPIYNFYVYLPNYEVKFFDTATDTILTLKQWRARYWQLKN